MKKRQPLKVFDVFGRGLEAFPLNPVLTINDISVSAELAYLAKDATDSTWPPHIGSTTYILAGVGSPPTVKQPTGLKKPFHLAVDFNDGLYFHGAGAEVGTNDFVLEFIARWPGQDGTYDIVIGKTVAAGARWNVFTDNAEEKWFFKLYDGTDVVSMKSSALTIGEYYHVIIFADRSGSAEIYVNGVASGSPLDITIIGDLSVGKNFSIGPTFTDHIVYVAVWQQADWLDTHLQPSIASQRYVATGI